MEALPKLYIHFVSVLKDTQSKTFTSLGKNLAQDLILRTNEAKILNFKDIEGTFYFWGYPEGNFIYQFTTIFEHWAKQGSFPIRFLPETSFTDYTDIVIESLNIHTKGIQSILEENISSSEIEKVLDEMIAGIGPRGILTMLGIRKTIGSAEMVMPRRQMLEEKFNKLHCELTEEELKTRKSIPKLSVGGKALSKHAHRCSSKFWGEAKGPELEKNKQASDLFNKILDNTTWINIHALPHSEYILEVFS